MAKGEILLVLVAVLIFAGFVALIFPHTALYKESYENNRQNAINYIYAYQYSPDEGYQKEIQKLVKKYHLEDLLGENGTVISPLEALLHEND